MSKNTVYLVSGGVNYYLSGGGSAQTVYAGSGTPWTAESTTPYELSMNGVTGETWVPHAATGTMLYAGGPPFGSTATPVMQSYGVVTETVGIQMRGTTKDNAVFLLRQLSRILNTTSASMPCVLGVAGSNDAFFEVYTAVVQETSRYLIEAPLGSSSVAVVRASITWTRSAFGGLLSTGETLINAVTVGNTGTGGTTNVRAYNTGTGDFFSEGGPLNVSIAAVGAMTADTMYIATIQTRTYNALGGGAISVPAGSQASMGTSVTVSISEAITNRRLRFRLAGRFTAAGTSISYSASIAFANGKVYTTRQIATPQAGSAAYIDFGTIPIPNMTMFGTVSAPVVSIGFSAYNSSGGAVNATPLSCELFSFYTMMIATTVSRIATTRALTLTTFPEQSTNVCLPAAGQGAYIVASGNIDTIATVRGMAPRYFPGSSLYLAWTNGGVHASAETVSVTARHAPLYRTIRGNL